MQLATGLRMPMLFFTQTWYVTINAPESQRTLLIGLLSTTRGLAFLAYILFGGALADRFPRRTTLLVAHAFGFVSVVAPGAAAVARARGVQGRGRVAGGDAGAVQSVRADRRAGYAHAHRHDHGCGA